MSEEPIVEPIASPKGDFKKLGRIVAVVGELREFLTLKGKSPKEMMGAVAESGLFKAFSYRLSSFVASFSPSRSFPST